MRERIDDEHHELMAFLENAEYHRVVAVTILQHRRKNIKAIMRTKFSR